MTRSSEIETKSVKKMDGATSVAGFGCKAKHLRKPKKKTPYNYNNFVIIWADIYMSNNNKNGIWILHNESKSM